MTKTILTVDDSASVRLMVSFTLNGLGMDVLEAENGAEALALLRTRSVDLVLADVNMPEMDGIEMVRRLRADPLTKDIPVVMLSTESSSHHAGLPDLPAPARWLTKPFDPAQLAAMVQQALA